MQLKTEEIKAITKEEIKKSTRLKRRVRRNLQYVENRNIIYYLIRLLAQDLYCSRFGTLLGSACLRGREERKIAGLNVQKKRGIWFIVLLAIFQYLPSLNRSLLLRLMLARMPGLLSGGVSSRRFRCKLEVYGARTGASTPLLSASTLKLLLRDSDDLYVRSGFGGAWSVLYAGVTFTLGDVLTVFLIDTLIMLLWCWAILLGAPCRPTFAWYRLVCERADCPTPVECRVRGNVWVDRKYSSLSWSPTSRLVDLLNLPRELEVTLKRGRFRKVIAESCGLSLVDDRMSLPSRDIYVRFPCVPSCSLHPKSKRRFAVMQLKELPKRPDLDVHILAPEACTTNSVFGDRVTWDSEFVVYSRWQILIVRQIFIDNMCVKAWNIFDSTMSFLKFHA